MSSKIYTEDDVKSIVKFIKDNPSLKLKDWKINKSNIIEEKDNHGLSVVGICEKDIVDKNGDKLGEIVLFNYTGVGGGWENDIYSMVLNKYIGQEEVYWFTPGDFVSGYHRMILKGDIFKNIESWDVCEEDNSYRILDQNLSDKCNLKIVYQEKENFQIDLRRKFEREKYCFYWDPHSRIIVYLKNIGRAEYLPSRQIIERRINERQNNKQHVSSNT